MKKNLGVINWTPLKGLKQTHIVHVCQMFAKEPIVILINIEREARKNYEFDKNKMTEHFVSNNLITVICHLLLKVH